MPELTPPPKPRRTYGFLSLAVLPVVAIIALAAAWGAMLAVERTSQTAVERGLFLAGEDWAGVEVNGLQVILSGDAPSEAARFAALSAAAHEVDGARVIDNMALPEAVAIEPPRFSVEMLRNEAGISLIGLIPAETDREALTTRMRAIDPIQPVADFLETAEYQTPPGWENALEFTLYVAGMLPRSKISMDADHVAVEAIAASPDEKQAWERAIRRERPAGLRLALDIRAPLDVISPYIVRFLSDDQSARFDACTAYTPADRNRIVSAGIAAGVKGAVDCTIGLGVPSPDWAQAVARGIEAVRDMGGGSLTFSDADITLIAPAQTPQNTYDQVIGELEADLPEVFSLHGVLSEPETGAASPAGTPEFIATLAHNGSVRLRGRVASEQDRTIVETLARARFGTKKVYAPLTLDPALPASWAVRTLAGLEALDQLADGQVTVRPDIVTVSGTTGEKGASAAISRLLSEKLGDAEDFRVNVTYVEALDPIAAMPTPQECVADVNAALTRNKITFAPGSAEIELASGSTVDRIAEILKTCPDVAMEIGGYTDSQGREEMNQALSQRRAEAVVSALLARRVLTTNLKAFGYGEEFPIADNDTDDGREANRRIEFSLVGETRPRAALEAGRADDPTIRPLARPTDLGAADEGAPAADDTAVEDLAAEEAGAEDTGAEDTGAAPEETVAIEPETASDAPESHDEADDAPSNADEDLAETAATEAEPDPAAVNDPPATSAVMPVTDTAAEQDAGQADAVDADDPAPVAAADPPATETGTDTVAGDDDTAAVATADTQAPMEAAADDPVAATPVAPADGAAAPATPAAVTAEGETQSPDVAGDIDETIAAPSAATETARSEDATDPGDATASDGALADLAPEDIDGTKAPGAILPTEDETETVSGEVAAAADGVTSEADAEGGPIPDPAAETATTTDQVAEADGTVTNGSEAAGEPAATAAPIDIPAMRPRARPPLVVHPDLEGVRPRPRPAVVPDAPTTE